MDLYAVSVDPPDASRRLRDRLEVQFRFLADTESALLDALGIRHHGGGADGDDIAFPTAVLVDSDGIVRWIYQSDTYRERARPEQIFTAIAAMNGNSGH